MKVRARLKSQPKASFIVREHARHPRLIGEGSEQACGRIETGAVHEQAMR